MPKVYARPPKTVLSAKLDTGVDLIEMKHREVESRCDTISSRRTVLCISSSLDESIEYGCTLYGYEPNAHDFHMCRGAVHDRAETILRFIDASALGNRVQPPVVRRLDLSDGCRGSRAISHSTTKGIRERTGLDHDNARA